MFRIIFVCLTTFCLPLSVFSIDAEKGQSNIDVKENKTEQLNPTSSNLDESKTIQEPIEFLDAWARPSLTSSSNSAAYLTIKNNSDEIYELLGASAMSVANNVELHQTYTDEKGVSKMTGINKILIPAHTEIVLKSGAMHIMLFDLKKALKVGDQFKLTLEFKNLGTKIIDVVVKNKFK